ncbi:glutathionylspermidine synthase family protein [Alteromonas aestuariivivens]|uniref:Glutathionylspermidine synthase family protein n=1 Tax=Alteromonas aestuariivivens TaxID=1938339 RepID=A0A3D8MEE8_9ALTE|nr:glutathionylspermidine synthase family protein [Alteromonas aestuariivivens]RDV29249.1 glutathionylspermidine synthase family protein [Alteromonas aestuariivivens]
MLRVTSIPRPDWKKQAAKYGFHFHTLYGEPYWDESAYYQFTLKQIEQDLEDPTAELHQMCLEVVDWVVRDERLLKQCQIPEAHWEAVASSWHQRQPSLYSRLDLVYSGQGPAKLLENNADTPTSLYESGFWQWLWLEQQVDTGHLPRQADQFNSLQEKLIARMQEIARHYGINQMHFACCKGTEEDRGTVQYLQDCAIAAGLQADFVFIEDIGLADTGVFTDLSDHPITECFKLYPWEFMLREDYADALKGAAVNWIEPLWKTVLSNKALLPLLWQRFPNHPNLLPAFFENELPAALPETGSGQWIKKPLFSREGANISMLNSKGELQSQLSDGPYGEEGFIIQAYEPLPRFDENYTLIGSWLVDNQPAGISIREDTSPITQDLSRYLPHIIA